MLQHAEILAAADGQAPRVVLPGRCVPYVIVDIVRSTERFSSVGDTAWTDLLQRFHNEAAGPVRRFGGRIVQKTGDGFLVSFPRPLVVRGSP